MDLIERASDLIEWASDHIERPVDLIECPVDLIEWASDHIEHPVDLIECPVDLIERASDHIEHPVDLIECPVDLIERASDHIERASDLIEWASDLIERASDLIEWASDLIEWPSDLIERASDLIAGPPDRTEDASDPAHRGADPIVGKRNPPSCVLDFMAKQETRRRGLEVADEGRASGVWEKAQAEADAEPPPSALGPLLARLYRAKETELLVHVERRGLPAHVAVEIRAESFLILANWVCKHGVPDDAAAMLHGIVRHLVSNHRRALQRARRRDGGDELDALPRSQRDPEQVMLAVAAAQELEVLLGELSEEAAWVVRLVELEGATAEEVAAVLGVTEEAARVRLHRAMKQLKALARRKAGG